MANVYDNIINGSFDAVGAPPSYITPAYRPEDYASIYAKPPTTPTYQSGMLGRGLPYQDPGRLLPDSKKLPSTLPDGFLWPPTLTDQERLRLSRQVASGNALMAQYNQDGTAKPIPAAPFVSVPTTPGATASNATWGPFEQAYANAATKPGTWLATSRMNAQALMRQMAALQGGMPMAPGAVSAAVPRRSGGLASLITGYGTPRAQSPGGLAGLLVAPAKTGPTGVGTNGYTYVNGQNMGYSAEEQAKRDAQGKAIAAANKKNPNPTKNVSGDNNAFAPKSVQESVRWQTGY